MLRQKAGDRAGKWGRAMAAMLAVVVVSACAGSKDNQPTVDTVASGPTPPIMDTITDPPFQSGSLGEFQNVVGDTIRFATDSYELDGSAQTQLQKQAAWLMQNQQWKVVLEGHADERGTREYNLALGERRATAATNYLIALGVDGARISVVSFGKERPICPEATEACWAENRRAVTALSE